MPRGERGERVAGVLSRLGLQGMATAYPAQLSGGDQQRVALARAMVRRPAIYLMDEPLGTLDAHLRLEMRELIRAQQLELGVATVYVTHDQEEANTISDRIAVLNHGIIQQVGSPLKLYDEPSNRFVANFLGSVNLIDGTVQHEDNGYLFKVSDGTSFPLGNNEINKAIAQLCLDHKTYK